MNQNNFPSRETVEELRKQYPSGCRVELKRMNDRNAPPIGTLGTVTRVDDIGSIMVDWDTGSHLSVVYGEDSCEVVNVEAMVKRVLQLTGSVPSGTIVVDADTLLCDQVENADHELSGLFNEIADIWLKSSDRKGIEDVFYCFTDMPFDAFVEKCINETTREEN